MITRFSMKWEMQMFEGSEWKETPKNKEIGNRVMMVQMAMQKVMRKKKVKVMKVELTKMKMTPMKMKLAIIISELINTLYE